MRFKKGFTLAEILIVLMVIGALATMTVPSLMTGVQNEQFKSLYKKALNSMTNLLAMAKLTGDLPIVANTATADKLFDILNSNLSVKGYALADVNNSALNSGKILSPSQILDRLTNPHVEGRYWNWIITEDNMAYLIKKGSKSANNNNNDTTGACKTKLGIIASQEENGPAAKDNEICFTIYVDVNGVASGPNLAFTPENNQINANDALPKLIYDQFPIYVGFDGATAGNPKTTVTGRIFAQEN